MNRHKKSGKSNFMSKFPIFTKYDILPTIQIKGAKAKTVPNIVLPRSDRNLLAMKILSDATRTPSKIGPKCSIVNASNEESVIEKMGIITNW